MICIGITGVFGSGKSTVSRYFKRMGIPVISCDSIVKQLLKTKKIREKILQKFGQQYISKDGQIDKKKLAKLVFFSSPERKKLNSIIHPEVFKRMETLLDIYKKKGKMAVVVEIPLLFETRSEKRFDIIITVYTPPGVIKERLKEKYSPEEIVMRLKAQMPLSKKVLLSDYVVDNSGSVSETKKQVKKIMEEIIRRHLKWQKKSKN